ncbi:hypothetical protein [Kitasatospora sp. NPDC050543]|uniref:hypothetical protein n=1 Tax=Kitasatospora sp. NPDC050543 TaxID=3364054 RepID=UPI0037A9AAA7
MSVFTVREGKDYSLRWALQAVGLYVVAFVLECVVITIWLAVTTPGFSAEEASLVYIVWGLFIGAPSVIAIQLFSGSAAKGRRIRIPLCVVLVLISLWDFRYLRSSACLMPGQLLIGALLLPGGRTEVPPADPDAVRARDVLAFAGRWFLAKTRPPARALGLLLGLGLMWLATRERGPRAGRLRALAQSEEVQAKRARSERELRDRSAGVLAKEAGLTLVFTVLQDTCRRGSGPDWKAGTSGPAMVCGVHLTAYFGTDDDVPDVLRRLETTGLAVDGYHSVARALRYYREAGVDDRGADLAVPMIVLAGSGRLTWDVPWAKEIGEPLAPSAGRDVIFQHHSQEPDRAATVAQIRESHRTVFSLFLADTYHIEPR